VRIARSIKDLAYKISRLKEQLTLELEHEPSIKLISERLGVSEYDATIAIESLKDSISMFEPIYNDGGEVIYLCDQLEDKSNKNFTLEERISLKEAMNILKEKEKYVINARYLVGKTQMELSEELGISQAQVSRLEKSGLERIKKKIL
jgi:RNA polymerase sporulation-specific sigma factor